MANQDEQRSNDHDEEESANPFELDEKGRTVAFEFVTHVILGLVAGGRLEPRGKTRREFIHECRQALSEWQEIHGAPVSIDHTGSILADAQAEHSRGRLERAALLYATWFEHWTNGVVSSILQRKSLSEESTIAIIRKTQLDDKLSWLLEVLELPPISTAHRNRIRQCAEVRNAFVHYKWKPNSFLDEQREGEDRAKVNSLLEEAEETVAYLESYRDIHVYGGRVALAKRLLLGEGDNAG
ncbi:MAG: hypothetical protein IPN34_14555 [Planctomycetes bacterium]|nr:hypothetical protein [Planctomycetota bacterium]